MIDDGPGSPTTVGALDGVRVLDLTTVLMGPLATRMLADHGADVIRVDAPGVAGLDDDPTGQTAIGLNIGRNKRSIQLDLKTEFGQSVVGKLLARTDVVVTNMRSSALHRLKLDPDQVRGRHPGLVYCVANGFGPDGPYAGRAAYDDAIQAASGLAALNQRLHGTPSYVPSAVVDKICSLHIVQAILAALLHRRATGEGQTIRVSMFETMVAFNLVEHYRGAALVPPKGNVGYSRMLAPDRRPYRCADGWVAILPYTDAHWAAFFALIDRQELTTDPRFGEHRSRLAHIDMLYQLIAEVAPQRTVAQWVEACAARSIPASEVLDLADLVTHPQVTAAGLIERTEHPHIGPYHSVNDPVSYDSLTTNLRRHTPQPGQHTEEILAELDQWADDREGP